MIATSGNVDQVQIQALTGLLAKANGGEETNDDAEKEKAEAEAQAEEKEKKNKADKAGESGVAKDEEHMAPFDVEQIAKAVAADLNKMMIEAEENTKLMMQPRGMFKNLSPDYSHEKDTKQHKRTNSTMGKEYNPNGMGMKAPHISQEG